MRSQKVNQALVSPSALGLVSRPTAAFDGLTHDHGCSDASDLVRGSIGQGSASRGGCRASCFNVTWASVLRLASTCHFRATSFEAWSPSGGSSGPALGRIYWTAVDRDRPIWSPSRWGRPLRGRYPYTFACALRQAGNGVSNHGKGLQPRITQLDGRQCGLERVDDDGAGC